MATIPAFATVAETGEAPPMATAHVLDFLQRYPTVAQLLQEAEGRCARRSVLTSL
jgi:hypothetical protein